MPEKEMKDVTIETVAGGAIPERFEHAWDQVLKNILDPNTDPKEVRSVTIEVAVKPGGERDIGAIKLSVRAKLAPPKPVMGTVYIGERAGQPVAVTYDPKQSDMFRDDAGDGAVRPISSKREA